LAGPSGKSKLDAAAAPTPRLRLDKWLFAARFFKSRELAHALVLEGHLRLNGVPCVKPAHAVAVGDVLTFVQGGRVRLVRINALSQRRGAAPIAQALYTDLDAPASHPPDQT
jgi:ribosome-associated heat shock protein Hsp15